MSLKSDRFREMEKIGKNISAEIPKLEAILDRYRLFNDDKLSHYVLRYFKYKMGTKPLRAYTTWKFFQYLTSDVSQDSKAILFSSRLPLVFELVVTVQYLHNHILDEKLDAHRFNHPRICKTIISSNILRELTFIYLEEEVYPLISPAQIISLTKAIRKLFLQVDIGQQIDKNFSTYHTWKNQHELAEIPDDHLLQDELVRSLMGPHLLSLYQSLNKGQIFTAVYFHRIYLTNVYFFRVIAETIIELTPGSEKSRGDELIKFSILYGFMLQIINDYADFAYSPNDQEREHLKTAGKKTTDFFADLYNFNITLPLIFHLQQDARRKIEAYLEGNSRRKKILNTYPKQIMQEIVQSGGIRKSIALSRDLAQSAVSHLNKENPVSPYLENMCDMAMNNKFYQLFN